MDQAIPQYIEALGLKDRFVSSQPRTQVLGSKLKSVKIDQNRKK